MTVDFNTDDMNIFINTFYLKFPACPDENLPESI